MTDEKAPAQIKQISTLYNVNEFFSVRIDRICAVIDTASIQKDLTLWHSALKALARNLYARNKHPDTETEINSDFKQLEILLFKRYPKNLTQMGGQQGKDKDNAYALLNQINIKLYKMLPVTGKDDDMMSVFSDVE